MDQGPRPLVYCARCDYGERVAWDQIGEWADDHNRHAPSVAAADPLAGRGHEPEDHSREDAR
jgi:hypothetical protein